MIALSHKTPYSHVVHVSAEESASTLFDLAKPGDTLHNVGVVSDDTQQLMSQIESQLMKGQYKKL